MTHCAVIWVMPEIFSFSGSVCCSFIRSVIVVVVVDGAVGKTSLLITYTYKRFRLWPPFPQSHSQRDDQPLTLQLFDTAGIRQAETYCVLCTRRPTSF